MHFVYHLIVLHSPRKILFFSSLVSFGCIFLSPDYLHSPKRISHKNLIFGLTFLWLHFFWFIRRLLFPVQIFSLFFFSASFHLAALLLISMLFFSPKYSPFFTSISLHIRLVIIPNALYSLIFWYLSLITPTRCMYSSWMSPGRRRSGDESQTVSISLQGQSNLLLV